jgi:hypothetical protein
MGERQFAMAGGDGGVIQVLLTVGVAPDAVDAEVQFERLNSQAFGFDEQSGHKSP